MYEPVGFYRQIGASSVVATPFSSLDAATIAWVNAVVANGGSVSGVRKTLVNDLIVGLKADGLFTKLDRLWLHAGENQPSALTDIVADSSATTVNSPTFTIDRGYTGNGTTSYLASGYKSSDGPNLAQNSAHCSAWVVTVDATNNAMILGAETGAGIGMLLMYSTTGPKWQTSLNQDFSNTPGPTGAGGTGLVTATRVNSTQENIYRNGGSKDTSAANSVGVDTIPFFICARNIGAIDNPSQHQIAATHFGGGLTDTDVTNIYNRLRTYMTAVGVP